ncbi:hypothetical protein JHK87_038659 [Glycine soja]|nr:hypothetical protein JHK87_038659 [Glycine soja]
MENNIHVPFLIMFMYPSFAHLLRMAPRATIPPILPPSLRAPLLRDQDVDIISVHHASGLIGEINLSNPLSTSDDLRFLGTFHVFSVTGFYNNNNLLSASSSPNNNSIPYSSSAIQFTRGSPPKLFEGLIGGKLIGVEPVQFLEFLTEGDLVTMVGLSVKLV